MRAWVVTSSAVVGSSAISTSGSPLSAIAIMTRCRIPPENSCGYASIRDAGSLSPTCPSSSTARVRAAALDSGEWSLIASTSWCPIRRTGLRAVSGSW